MVASQNNGSSQTDQVNSNPPLWLHQLLIALALLAGLILAIAIIRLIVKALRGLAIAHIDPLPAGTTWPVGQARTLAPAQVDQAIDQAITRLQEAASPSDAIIGAWLALEEAASRHGVVRQVWQTPTEFTRTVFRLGDRVGQPLDNLRRLYARARFSDQPSSSADVDAAQQALTEIRRSWSSQTGQS
jgi:hypothetical protein